MAATAGLVLLLLRAVRLETARAWLLLGLATGMALHTKNLPALVLASCLVGLATVGPRRPLCSRWPWLAAGCALVISSPAWGWQATHGWPQLQVAAGIADGASGSSNGRFGVLLLQIPLIGPGLLALFVVGLVALWRSAHRWLAVAYLGLLTVIIVTDGRAYHAAGLYPAVLAAAAAPTLRWTGRGRRPGRRQALLVAAVVGNVVGGTLATLPWLPASRAQPLVAVFYDAGEQIGWPDLVAQAAAVVDGLPADEREKAVV